jgi:hypothetical protein
MARKRLGWIGWTITILYLASFALPVGDLPGIAYFAFAIFAIPLSPVFVLIWAANPLFWAGLSYLRRGHWGCVTTLGIIACLSAYLPLVPNRGSSILAGSAGILKMSGYFAWLASMALLAAAGVTGWATEGFSTRPQLRLKTLMISIAVLALLLSIIRILPRLIAMMALRRPGDFMG